MSKTLPIIVGLAWVGTAILFLAFSMIAGGAAVTGKIVAGHYYLGGHGNYPEVSRGVYVLSALFSMAFSVSLPVFAGVMTWHESRKPTFNPFLWVGPLLALVVGLIFCYLSIRCIVSALSGA